MPKTVLVTGATGFVASNLIPKLAKRGYKIRAFVRKGATQEQLKELILHKCEIVYATNSKQLEEVCEGVYGIVNLAGILNEDASKKRTYKRVNSFIQHLARAAKKQRVEKIVHLSSLTNGNSKYSNAKKKGEQTIIQSKVSYTILKSSIILGKGCDLIKRLKKSIKLPRVPVFDKGQVQPIYAKDIVRYLIKALEDKRSINSIFEIAGPTSLSYKEFVENIARKMNKPIKTLTVPITLAKIPVKLGDILTAYPPVTSAELNLIQNSQKIYAEKSAHQFGIKLTPLSEMLDKSL